MENIFNEILPSIIDNHSELLDQIRQYNHLCKQTGCTNNNASSYFTKLKSLKAASDKFIQDSLAENKKILVQAANLKSQLTREQELASKYLPHTSNLNVPNTLDQLTTINIARALEDCPSNAIPLYLKCLDHDRFLLVYKSRNDFLICVEYNSVLSFIRKITSADVYASVSQVGIFIIYYLNSAYLMVILHSKSSKYQI